MHLLVVANETVTGTRLIEAIEKHRADDDLQVTVVCPVNQPQRAYVVYEDTRRAAAGRRLEKTLAMLRGEGIRAHGLVVETDPVTAVRDAIAQLEPPVEAMIVAGAVRVRTNENMRGLNRSSRSSRPRSRSIS